MTRCHLYQERGYWWVSDQGRDHDGLHGFFTFARACRYAREEWEARRLVEAPT